MSKTPTTDALIKQQESVDYTWRDKFNDAIKLCRELERENVALRSAIKRIHSEWGRLVHAEDNLDDAIWAALAFAEKEKT